MQSLGVFVLFFLFLCFCTVSGEICQEDVCEYYFEIRHQRTMTYQKGFLQTYNAMWNGTNVVLQPDKFGRTLPTNDDVRDEVVTADGVVRNIITVNGTYPGPAIEVMEGAQIVVHVSNTLLTQSVSIHWHGIHQQKTPWMDGTAFVTQCPIAPRQSFTYRFFASPAGTHWYHDHLVGQRSDGLLGMLIVHKRMPVLPEARLVISDWFHVDSITTEITGFLFPQGGSGDQMVHPGTRQFSHDLVEVAALTYVSGLINGRGRFGNDLMPLSTTMVQVGQTTRFRVVNTGAEYYFEVSVDKHQLEIIALDGHDIDPITADSFIIGTGERIDFLLVANETTDNYWLRCKTLTAVAGRNLIKTDPDTVLGIIRYEGAPDQDPTSEITTCLPPDECLVFNCPFAGYPAAQNKKCIIPNEVRSTMPQTELDKEFGLKDEDYIEKFLNFGLTNLANINGVIFKEPHMPYSDPDYNTGIVPCEDRCKNDSVRCSCTQTIEVPFNKTIQMVFSNYRPVPKGRFAIHNHHSIHMHGHTFAVVKTGFPTYNRTTGRVIDENRDVSCDTPICRTPNWTQGNPKELNLDHPSLKDTILVPALGYVVIRFRSTNPGHWFLHCHVESHANIGMALVMSEAVDHIPVPPENFPRCSPFQWSESQFSSYTSTSTTSQSTSVATTEQPSTRQDKVPNCSGQTLSPQLTTLSESETSDDLIKMSKEEVVGLIIGCVAFGAVLILIPFIIVLCLKSAKV